MTNPETMSDDCCRLRRTILDMIHTARSGHAGGSLSCVEILWTLYSQVLRVRPEDPGWAARDRFILSKGHGAPALYAVLAARGFFPHEWLTTLRRTGSHLQGHPDMHKTPGVDMSTGSLGMGISAGVGMALAARLSQRDYRVFVLVGDGELQEGQNWEGLMAARKFGLSNLVVVVDRNRVQLDGPTEEVMPLGDVAEKIAAFGMEVRVCDGHNCGQLLDAWRWTCAAGTTPRVIVANTIKGKGVSFMEGQSAWHGARITDEDYRKARKELAA